MAKKKKKMAEITNSWFLLLPYLERLFKKKRIGD